MDEFIGRTRELAALEAAYQGEAVAFLPIYGRRRVGKSELILRFLRRKPAIYFLGQRGQAGVQIREFLAAAAALHREPLLASLPADSWKVALEAAVDRWKGPGKLVLAFDEFQWTVEASPELPGVLQEAWDRRWRNRRNVVLILCGSYVGFMEREVLGKRSPLFGRRTGQILLRPFPFAEAARFHPSYSPVDRARTYFLCGGIPLYLRCFRADRSVESNIAAGLLDEFAPLHREPDFLLREELRGVENYYAILLAMASGATTARDISARTQIGERALHYYLSQLVDLGYLARRYPLTEHPPAARHVRYSLEDPLLRFWFRFVYPNASFIRQRGPERSLADIVRPGLDSFFGAAFERLCREALPLLYAREGVTSAFDVGEYWDKATQIDVVGLRRDGWTDLGECRWGAAASPRALAAELEEKIARYPNERNATIGRRLFSRDRPRRRSALPPGVRWHSLEDLYAAGTRFP